MPTARGLFLALGLMERFLACVLALAALSGCAIWSDGPRLCFSPESTTPAGAAQAEAIEYVKRKEASRCSAAGIECSLRLSVRPTSEIAVMVSWAFLNGKPPSCTHLEGAFKTYVFTSSGEYSRVELGL